MRELGTLTIATALVAAFAVSASADPILEVSGGVAIGSGLDNLTAGWSFTTIRAITVTALDSHNPTADGLVRLYDGSSNIIASVDVTKSDPTEGSPTSFYSAAITPVTLAANTTYYIAEDVAPSTLAVLLIETSTPTTGSLITYDGAVSAAGYGATPTTDLSGGAGNPAYFGPDFDATAAAITTPEPASIALLLSGLFGLRLIRRRIG